MILLLLAQLAVTSDSTYSSAALRTLVARAAIENHAPPPSLRGYRAHVESEMSLILRDTLGREGAGQVEQLASTVDWTRGNAYDMHIVGYRAQRVLEHRVMKRAAGPSTHVAAELRGDFVESGADRPDGLQMLADQL